MMARRPTSALGASGLHAALLALALATGAGHAAAPAFPQIAGSGLFVIAHPDGTVAVLGDMTYLPPGDGRPTQQNQAYRMPRKLPGIQNAVGVAATSEHALVLLADGRVLGWGEPCQAVADEQRNGASSVVLPTPVPGVAGAAQVVAGSGFSLARLADGGLLAWGGLGADGGNGCAVRRLAITGVSQVVAGSKHALALRSDGTVAAFGENREGVLGDGSEQQRPEPVAVKGLRDIVQVAANTGRSFALQRDGRVWQWGLGLGPTPQPVAGLGKVVAMAASRGYVIVQLADGTLRGWGEGYGGVLGEGSFDRVHDKPVAVRISGPIAAWSTNTSAVFAWRADGTLWGWGAHGFTAPGAPRAGHSVLPEPLLKWTAPASWQWALRGAQPAPATAATAPAGVAAPAPVTAPVTAAMPAPPATPAAPQPTAAATATAGLVAVGDLAVLPPAGWQVATAPGAARYRLDLPGNGRSCIIDVRAPRDGRADAWVDLLDEWRVVSARWSGPNMSAPETQALKDDWWVAATTLTNPREAAGANFAYALITFTHRQRTQSVVTVATDPRCQPAFKAFLDAVDAAYNAPR